MDEPIIRWPLRFAAGPAWIATIAIALASLLAASGVAAQELGTQPGTLTRDLAPPTECNACHGEYAEYAANDTWRGSMMANSARDPLFRAALSIANQDIAGSGQMCIRCHAPRAYLFGRSDPPDGSAFEPEDLEGVTCDLCHRLIDGPDGIRPIGMGQYYVADDSVRRGPLTGPLAPHETAMSTYHRDSALCGICHDVSNPFRDGFAIERTYTEWLSSAYPAEGWTCNSCHLPGEVGTAANTPEIRNRIVHQHELAGGNTWMPLVLAGEYPQLDREEAFARTADAARRQLQESSANLVIVAPTDVLEGSDLELLVRVENLTGHKLPTGYSEGRRCWLDVVVQDANGRVLLHSGAYDDASARRVSRDEDPQLRTYEARMSAGGVEGFHFVLQDGLIADTRIPPRGFTPTEETAPVGRDYPVQPDGSLAHWDEAPYRIRVPGNAVGPLTVRATLRYQTASRDYVELLRDENHTDDNGSRMFELWERYDRSPPVDMVSDGLTVTVIARPDSGCDVAHSGRSSGSASVVLAAIGLLAVGGLRRWSRSGLRRSLPWRG